MYWIEEKIYDIVATFRPPPNDWASDAVRPPFYAPGVTLRDKVRSCKIRRALNVEPLLLIERTQRKVVGPCIGLPDAFCKNTGHFDLSTVPDLICVVMRKRHRENRATFSIVKTQLIICLYFGWLITFLCVRDAKTTPRIASIAANKLR